jgi:predicted lipoprotein with Yx(FWY)xxD motif
VEAGEADPALLGTVTRPDGEEQVTYNGFPLYYFSGDLAAGDATGEGLNGVWFIADPAGN